MRRNRAVAPPVRTSVCVVGLGNWGTSLTEGLRIARIPVREIVVLDKTARSPNRRKHVNWANAALDSETIWLCVPDRKLALTAIRVAAARGDMRGQTVVHSSGALTIDVLASVRQAGASVASVHPAMSFPTRTVVPLRGLSFAVEADGAATRRKMNELVQRMGGRAFPIDSDKKSLYHAAGTMASPLLLSVIRAAIDTAKLAGLTAAQAEAVVGALSGATVRNVSERGFGRSFSGPFARGDSATVDLHLQALAQHPMLEGVYRVLAQFAVETLPVKKPGEIGRLLDRKK